ncbi:MAG: hypothetical protein KC493_15165 [Bacteriovoracaceae bacterium]|nr:hypothetical protein [Bacteriovoracaceae bacterium]
MKTYLISILVLLSTSLNAEGLPSQWYFGEETKSNNEKSSDPYDIDKSLESLHDAQTHALKKVDSEKSGWYLAGMKTILGLTLKGKLGIKSWGGKKAIELNWKKRDSKKGLEETENNVDTFNFSEYKSSEDALTEIEPFISSLVESGKVNDEKSLRNNLRSKINEFYQVAKGAESAAPQAYRPHKIRLDLTVGADGSVNGLFVKVGGDIRLRFEWSRKNFYQKESETLKSKITKQTEKLLNGLASEIGKAIEEEPAAKTLKLKEFKVGVGVSVSGSVGVAKVSASIVPQVYFKKVTLLEKAEEVSVEEIPFLTDDKSNELKFVSSTRIRKGFKKSIRFAEYFQKKFNKKKYRKSKWAVHTIKPSYTFDLSGDVGVVSLKGLATFELAYVNNKF